MQVSISHPTNRPNYAEVQVGPIRLMFSYQTVVAFSIPGTGTVVSENCWGPTTGKHLGYCDGGSPEARARRLPRGEFEAALEAALSPLGVEV